MSSIAASSSYRAQARTIRARLANRPTAMHQALHKLNRQPSFAEPLIPVARIAADPGILPAAVDLFTQSVLSTVDGPLLRYSFRQRLLRQADGLGIHRFEANLIIATIQHRRRHDVAAEDADASASPRRMGTLLVALALQIAIIVAAVWLFL